MANAIILCSGGLDSVVTAHYVKKKLNYEKLKILFFDYGQRAVENERKAARKCAKDLGAEFREIKIDIEGVYGDLINNSDVKSVSREDLKDTSEEAKKWYVPHRNLIFLSYAMSIAETGNLAGERWDVFVGFKNEGKESFPDATEKFVKRVNDLRKESSETEFVVRAPMIRKDKEEIVKIGVEMGVNLSETFSCYVGSSEGKHCGKCLACALRKEGFYWANVGDGTAYEN